MTTVLRDLRLGVRLLLKAPAFTAIALLALALSIGANTAMFSITRAVLLRPLPYPDPGALMQVRTVQLASKAWVGSSPPDFYALRDEARSFSAVAAFYERAAVLTGGDQAERIRTSVVSADLFRVLGVAPVLGRAFDRGDEAWGAHRRVVLTDAFWHSRFGADPGVLGKTVTLGGQQHEVVGVLPAQFRWLEGEVQLFVPMAFEPGDNLNSHNNYFLDVVGRRRAGVTEAQAHLEVQAIGERIRQQFPESRGLTLGARPLEEAVVATIRPAILVLFGAVGLVLLIACANLAHLQLVRGSARQRELGIRSALGASRGDLVRQLLAESVVLGVLGSAAGLLLAAAILKAVNALSQEALPRLQPIGIDWGVLGFALLAGLLTAVLFGLMPALSGSAISLSEFLNETTSSETARRRRLSATLVVAETAFALILLSGAGLALRSFQQLLQVELGHEPRGLLSAEIDLPASKYVDPELARALRPGSTARGSAFFDQLIASVGQLREVRAVGAVSGLPLAGNNWGKHLVAWDRPLPGSVSELPTIEYRVIAGDYFRALGIPVRGRTFSGADELRAPHVAIVSRETARRIWGKEDALGKLVSVNVPRELLPGVNLPADYQPEKLTVVGVAGDVPYDGLEQGPSAVVYAPYAQGAEGLLNMILTVRTDGDPLSVVAALREQVRKLDPDQPIANVATLETGLARAVAAPRLRTLLRLHAATLSRWRPSASTGSSRSASPSEIARSASGSPWQCRRWVRLLPALAARWLRSGPARPPVARPGRSPGTRLSR
jgi:putative ABC transport system permease protein